MMDRYVVAMPIPMQCTCIFFCLLVAYYIQQVTLELTAGSQQKPEKTPPAINGQSK